MEGSGGHTKECKVRTTTSANPPAPLPPVLAAAPSIPCFIRPHPRQPALPPPPLPSPPFPLPPSSPTNHRIYLLLHRGIVLLCRRLQRIIVQGGGSSPRLPLIVFPSPRCVPFFFLSLFVLTHQRLLAPPHCGVVWCFHRGCLPSTALSNSFPDKRRAPSSRRSPETTKRRGKSVSPPLPLFIFFFTLVDGATTLVADPRVVTRRAPNSTPSGAIIHEAVRHQRRTTPSPLQHFVSGRSV